MTETDRKEIHCHLVNGLNSLAAQGEGESLVVENCPDETDIATQLAQHGVNVAMQRRRIARMHELENALRRLGETDYGMCEECGGHIGLARLKANPSARLCVVCQSEIEDGLTRCA